MPTVVTILVPSSPNRRDKLIVLSRKTKAKPYGLMIANTSSIVGSYRSPLTSKVN